MEIENEFREALNGGDLGRAGNIARRILDQSSADSSPSAEDTLGYYVCCLAEREAPEVHKLLSTYIDRFPNSLHLARIYRADLLAQAGHYDLATEEARFYLRQVQDAGLFPQLASQKIVRNGVTRGFLLLTAVYTELGARNYSKRVLDRARLLDLDPDPEWKKKYDGESKNLNAELETRANAKIDKQWESFFSKGKYASDLYKLAEEKGFELLAKRLDLIETNFRFNQGYRVGPEEILQLVQETDKGAFLLA